MTYDVKFKENSLPKNNFIGTPLAINTLNVGCHDKYKFLLSDELTNTLLKKKYTEIVYIYIAISFNQNGVYDTPNAVRAN